MDNEQNTKYSNDLKDLLDDLNRLLNDYSNEIPSEIMHSTMIVDGEKVNPKYKVRKGGWFQGIYQMMGYAIDKGYIGDNTVELFDKFKEYAKETKFNTRPLTNGEDIRRGDEIIISAINDLEAKLEGKD